MGVFASKSLCLDRRLQDRPGIRDLVIRLLDILVEALEEVTSNNEPHQNQTMSEPEFPLENKSEIDDLTEDIETSLVSLSRLGTTIRKYSTTGRTARIRKFAEQSASLKAFEKLARVAVDTLYMEAKDTLRAQLTRSMVETCASILYKKSHQKKMNTNRPTRDVPMPTIREERDDNLANSAENFNIDDPIVQILPDSAPKPNQLRPYAPLESTPSILDSLRTTVLKDLGRSSKVKSNCSASSIQLGKVSYPRASGGKDASGYRTCKWCLERHPPALFDSKKQWSSSSDEREEPKGVIMARHIAEHLQISMLLTMRLINCQQMQRDGLLESEEITAVDTSDRSTLTSELPWPSQASSVVQPDRTTDEIADPQGLDEREQAHSPDLGIIGAAGNNAVETTSTLGFTDLKKHTAGRTRNSSIAAAGRSSRRPSSTNGIDLENDRLTRQNSISPALPCHVIQPPKNPYFVGRGDILEELEANLISNSFKSGSDWNTRAFAIWGPPGVGKSQTALHFAYTHEKEFPSILFTGADTETKLLSDLAAYSQTIGLTTEDQSKNLPGQVRRLLEWYETTDVRWLLIFDNAKSVELITDFWPKSKVGAIIITSLGPHFASNTVAGAGKELKSLHDEEAIQLLEKQLADQSTTNFDRNEALQIVRRMENLPLGIQASVGLINDVQCSLRDFNRQWTSPRDVIMDSTQDHTKTRFAKYPKALGDAWLDALSALRPESRAMIDVMALLDPDNIQEEIFEERVSLGYPSTMPFLGNKTKCLGDLRSQGLLSYGGQSQSFGDGKSYINIHRMLQDCIKIQMSDNPICGNEQTALGNASALISSLISSLWETDWIKIRKEYKNFLPHAETIRRFFHDRKDASLMKVPISFLEMLRKAAGTAEDIIEYPTQSSLKTEGTEEAILNEIIEIRYLHACISTETAEFEESLEHFELAKKSYEKFEELGYVKKNSTRYMTIVGGIADSLTGLRRNKEAEVYYLECIELAPPGGWQPYDINICRCLWDTGIPEKLNEGADRLNTWIATRAAIFGPDDQYDYLSGQAKYVLGNIRISQGKYDEAFELHMSTVKNFKAVLGDDDHKTGDAYHKAGWHFDRIGNYEEAKKYLKNALKVYQLGSDATYRSGEIARTTFKLSLVLAKMGRTQKAEDERKTAEVFRQKSMGRKYFPSDEESEYDHLVSLWAR
ncbi:hypothetical protein TWF788_000138 [Orbilia oligospora]|uniref:DUF7779 domain-containing protein n=1 Tax=Orbilia oligospora TaxID=2813651 RepID=A0A7C8Q4B2_ORBOL|nr:hypothetical protein TWF788_000138 [Orbilia oligospora]